MECSATAGRPHGAQRRQRGTTLPELLLGTTLVVLLATGAISGYSRLIRENRMTAEVNRFVSALQLARSEAVKHGRRALLCPSRDAQHCSDSRAWSHGWILFASDNREREAHEPLLQAGSPLGAGITMHSSNHRRRILYQPDGTSGGSNSSFTFCDTRNAARPRVICLANSGRPRVSRTRCDGRPVRCP